MNARNHRYAVTVIVVGVAAAAALAGCSSGSAPGTAGPTAGSSSAVAASTAAGGTTAASSNGSHATNPCTLLSVQDASALTHQTFVSAEPDALGTQQTCTYAPGGETAETLRVSITRSTLCWAGEQGIGEGTAQKVAGVGDDAIGYAAGLAVKHGSDVCVDVNGETSAESTGDWSADIAVANAVLAKLS